MRHHALRRETISNRTVFLSILLSSGTYVPCIRCSVTHVLHGRDDNPRRTHRKKKKMNIPTPTPPIVLDAISFLRMAKPSRDASELSTAFESHNHSEVANVSMMSRDRSRAEFPTSEF